jgi:hypothetical protein
MSTDVPIALNPLPVRIRPLSPLPRPLSADLIMYDPFL